MASFGAHDRFHLFYNIELGELSYTPGAGQTDQAWKSTEKSHWCPSDEVQNQFIQDWDYFRPLGPEGENRSGAFLTGVKSPVMLAEVITRPVISAPSKTLDIAFIRGRREDEKLQDAENANRVTELSDDEG